MNGCNLDILQFGMVAELVSRIIITHPDVTDACGIANIGIGGIGDSKIVGW